VTEFVTPQFNGSAETAVVPSEFGVQLLKNHEGHNAKPGKASNQTENCSSGPSCANHASYKMLCLLKVLLITRAPEDATATRNLCFRRSELFSFLYLIFFYFFSWT
jgi:hypothetical protein